MKARQAACLIGGKQLELLRIIPILCMNASMADIPETQRPQLITVDDDEKDSTLLQSPPPGSPEPAFDYTEEEERRVRLKLNLTVLPLLFIGFYVFQVGCVNARSTYRKTVKLNIPAGKRQHQ